MIKQGLKKQVVVRLFVLLLFVMMLGAFNMSFAADPGSMTPEGQTPSYAPGEIIFKVRTGIAADLKNAVRGDTKFRVKGDAITGISGLPATVKSLIKGDTVLEPVFQAIHARMRTTGQIESELNQETFDRLKAKRKMPVTEPKNYQLSHIYVLKNINTQGRSIEEIAAELKQDPNIEYAEPNYLAQSTMVPNDPFYSSYGTWGQSFDDLWGLKKIQAAQAWDLSQGEGQVIAIIGTGVDYNHEDLAANIWINTDEIPGNGIDDDHNGEVDDVRGWDFGNDDNDPMDVKGHETHCAGTAAAVGNNNLGIVGVAPQAKIMSLKIYENVLSPTSIGEAAAIEYAVDKHADVISVSQSHGRNTASSTIETAVKHAYELGVLIVYSAGNFADNVDYYSPQNMPEVITVANTGPWDTRSSSSNWGARISLAAPGESILSLHASTSGDVSPLASNSKYAVRYGTSMSAPHVAGLAALVLAQHADYDVRQVKKALQMSAVDIEGDGWNMQTGYGRIDAYTAVTGTMPQACEAMITSPKSSTLVSGSIQIKGKAFGPGFQEYSLYYINTKDLASGAWNLISQCSYSVSDDILKDGWDVSALIDGDYVVKLVVKGELDYTYEDHIAIKLDNTYFTYPTGNSVQSIGGNIALNGTININGSFQIEYASASAPEDWSNAGITLANGGSAPVTGSLATWNTSGLSAGYYYLKILVNNIEQERIKVYMDPTLKQGWPLVVPKPFGMGSSYRFNVVTANMNADATKEIIFPIARVGSNDPSVRSYVDVRTVNGESLNGWPVILNDAQEMPEVAVGDVDNDGHNEVVVIANSSANSKNALLYILGDDGNIKVGPKIIDTVGLEKNSPILADVNLDGRLEIIVKSRGDADDIPFFSDGKANLHLLDSFGNEMDGWPKQVDSASAWCWMGQTPAVGNMDTDPYLEIVIVVPYYVKIGDKYEQRIGIHVFDYDGTEIASQTINDDMYGSHSSPVIADINNDYQNEIVFNSSSNTYALTNEGQILWSQPGGGLRSSPAIANWDQNVELEIIRTTTGGQVQILNYLGNVIKTWTPGGTLEPLSPVVGDITGDGLPDIVIASYEGCPECPGRETVSKVSAMDNSGASIPGFPKRFQMSPYSSKFQPVIIDDLDGDNQVELVAGNAEDWDFDKNEPTETASIYVWDLDQNATYNVGTMQWPMWHHDAQHTGASSGRCAQVSCDDNNACTADFCDEPTGNCVHTAKNCSDSNACTDDSCEPATGCVHTNNTASCDDGIACSTGDVCSNGVCVGTLKTCNDNNACTTDTCDTATGNCVNTPVNINDNNLCTTDTCDPATGAITHTPVDCDDNNACTIDYCASTSGNCVNTPVNINDNNLCTTDTCDPATGAITHTPVDCNDNNACTTDTCDTATGNCVNTPVNINDNDACTTDTCDPITGITHTPIVCDDNNPCTTNACYGETGCMFTLKFCNDGSICTTDTCDTATGSCVYTPITCTDNNLCTTDTCNAFTGCVYTPVNINDNNLCTTDTCDPITGITHTTVDCNDNNPCTTDTCNAFTGCVYTPVNINDNNLCTTDSCDPITGVTHTSVDCNDNNACTTDGCYGGTGCYHWPVNVNDNNACTSDTCDPATGAIAHTPVVCNDSNVCTTDTCNSSSGCVYTNNTLACDDNNLCTVNDVCSSGVCGGTAKVCDDNNACTTNACDAANGCMYIPMNFTDNNLCTLDTCDPASGIAHTPIDCNDNNACTTDTCDTATGNCVHTPVVIDDNDACTTDACDPMTGIAHTPIVCNDTNACTDDSCSATLGCIFMPINYPDSDPCTIDTCDPLIGPVHTPINCDDGNVCSDDSCDPVTGNCVHANNTLPCNDSNACTENDVCSGGACVPGTPRICDDNNACTTDTCDPSTGCVSNTIPGCGDSTDNNFSMSGSNGIPFGGTNDVHFTWDGTLKTAVSTTGQISNATLTSSCPFGGSLWMAHDVAIYGPGTYTVYTGCAPGAPGCGSGVPIIFTVGANEIGVHLLFNWSVNTNMDVVNVWQKNAVFGPSPMWTGSCGANPADKVWDGMSKDWDENGVNGYPLVDGPFVSWVLNFNVMGLPPGPCADATTRCNDNDLCTTDTCDRATGDCINTPVSSDDDDACTIDTCDPITGIAHTQIVCNDNDLCTTDTCNTITGCVYTPVSTNDNDACTTDTCDPATGVITHSPLVCNDNDACTTDTCNPATGCVYTPLVCNDNNTCTTDTCNPATGCVSTPLDNGTPCTGVPNGSCQSGVCVSIDLVPTAITASKSGATKVVVGDTAQNQGTIVSDGTFTITYYLSTDTTYESGTDIALASSSNGTGTCSRTVASLASGASNTISSKTCYKPSGTLTGVDYYVLVRDDSSNTVSESSEANNVMATTGTIRW